MHSYLIVAAKPGRSIPPHVLDLLDQAHPTDVAFLPERRVRWTDARGRLAYGGWQSATDVVGIGSHWHVDDHGLTAFSGRLWPHGDMWSVGAPWAAQLHALWRKRSPDKVGQPFDGIFTAASLRPDGTGEIITDPLSAGMVYRAESNDLIAYSTRPGLAARATTGPGQEPARDALGSGWMIYIGYLFGDRTGFERVRVLPLGSYVELHPRYGSRVRTANPSPWIAPEGLSEDPAALVSLVHDDLVRRVESIAKLPSEHQHRADITGGRDSRLVLALLMEAGITDRFRFSTMGGAQTPDAVVGRELAELCGLQFDAIEPGAMEDSQFLRRLQVHSFQTSGMGNAWDLQGGIGISRTVAVSGFFGEPLKTQFSGWRPIETTDDLLPMFLKRAHVDTLGILRPEAKTEYARFIAEDLVERMDAESSLPFDRLDAFYIRNRLRRWGGTIEELGQTTRVFPLYSLVALQAGFVLGPARRRNEYLHFHVMQKACAPLVEHRFAGRGWRDSLLSEMPDGDRYRVEPCTSSPRAEDALAPLPWQADRFDRHRDIIEAYLLNTRGPLLDVVDRAAVEQVLAGDLPPGFLARYQVFGALAAAVWLAHHELEVGVGTKDVRHIVPNPLPVEPPPPAPPPTPSMARRVAHRLPAPVRRGLLASRRAARPRRAGVRPAVEDVPDPRAPLGS